MCLASSSVRVTKPKLTNSHQACISCRNIGARNCVDIFRNQPLFQPKNTKNSFKYLLLSTVLTTFCKNSRPYHVLRFRLQLIPQRGVLKMIFITNSKLKYFLQNFSLSVQTTENNSMLANLASNMSNGSIICTKHYFFNVENLFWSNIL